jgi:hypothetical protein
VVALRAGAAMVSSLTHSPNAKKQMSSEKAKGKLPGGILKKYA